MGESPAVDAANCSRELLFEHGELAAVEDRGDDGIGPLEEVVDDLDLADPGAETGECIDKSLQAVVRLDDLLGSALCERVGLVVEYECAVAFAPEQVEPAAQ